MEHTIDHTLEENIVKQWPLIGSTAPIFTWFCLYLIFVKQGPKWMSNKKPYEFKTVMFAYNFFIVFFSLWQAYLCREGMVTFLTWKTNIGYLRTHPHHLTNGMWWYQVTKIIELLDTVFMILRKKDSQVSFLHVYHHAAMLIVPWYALKYYQGDSSLYAIFINSIVHVIMYSYYFLAAFGPKIQKYLWWKKYITRLQLAQFVSGLIYVFGALLTDKDCKAAPLVIQIVMGFIFLYLFGQFYNTSYKKRSTVNTEKL